MNERGEVVARGTRSTVHAYGPGAVVKVPVPSTPEGWIAYEARYAEAARAAGAPAPRLLGLETIEGRTASIWERVEGTSMWQLVVDRPDQSAPLGRLLADIQQALFALVPPVTLPRQRDRVQFALGRRDQVEMAAAVASSGQAGAHPHTAGQPAMRRDVADADADAAVRAIDRFDRRRLIGAVAGMNARYRKSPAGFSSSTGRLRLCGRRFRRGGPFDPTRRRRAAE